MMKERYGHFIDGDWSPPVDDKWIPSENPFTRQTWTTIAEGTPADVEKAVAAAHSAFAIGPWGRLTASARGAMIWRMGDVLRKNAERLAELESRDNGRAVIDTIGAVNYLAGFFEYFGGLADKIEGSVPPIERPETFNYIRHEPYGVVGAIIPWNAPLLLTIWKLAPGLAAGNTFVIKPHEAASVSILELAALFSEAGFPAGVVNVVTGTGAGVGEPLVRHPKVAKIAFTGGDFAGRKIYETAARDFKPVTLELGGKSPSIIFDDANIEHAAIGSAMGMFTASGQACVACSRVLVQENVYDRFVEQVRKQASAARMGDPLSRDTDIGPMGSKAQYDRTLNYLDIARKEGAKVAFGGGPSTRDGCTDSYFIEPTLLTNVDNSMRVAREEIFGPVMACIPFKDEEEAIAIANDTNFGLGAGIWTENLRRAIRVADRLESGTVYVNTYRLVSYMSPFGGYKHSGLGRENGQEAIFEYLQTKSVWISLSENPPPTFGKPYG